MGWITAGLVAASLAGYVVWSSIPASMPVAVDVEDDAVAALRLYLEQQLAYEATARAPEQHQPDVAARHADGVETALEQARERVTADVAARAYWGNRRHDELVTALRDFDGDLVRLEPPAEVYLRVYVARLPAGVVTALRGHPVAGPGLNRLDHGP